MWIMLNDAFFSIVAKDCRAGELMVRARRPGDIEKVFPSSRGRVTEFTASDYHYRCAVPKDEIKRAMCREIDRIAYKNFKDSVGDARLHNAYHRVWGVMANLQPKPPFAGRRDNMQRRVMFAAGELDDDPGLTPEDVAKAFATDYVPEDDFLPGFDGPLLANTKPPERTKAKKKRAKRSLKRGR